MADTPLGRPTGYPDRYDPDLLAPMDRAPSRSAMGIADDPLPFAGEDVWNGYEFSWLSDRGVPRVAALQVRVPAHSPYMVESKSMKLYLNGFAQERFDASSAVVEVLEEDLSRAFGERVRLQLTEVDGMAADDRLPGSCLDYLDVEITAYDRDPGLLATGDGEPLEETVHCNLFRSLCPVTGQPDWASVLIRYAGVPLDHRALLRYLISYRRHQAFHEATVEQIFVDLKRYGGCERLLVGGYFLRRGGLDINPFRADPGETWPVLRLPRQ